MDKTITVGYVLNTNIKKSFDEVCAILNGINKKDIYIRLTSNTEEFDCSYLDLIGVFCDLYNKGIISDCKDVKRTSHLLNSLAATIRSLVYLSHGTKNVGYFDIFICVDKTIFDVNLARELNGFTFI